MTIEDLRNEWNDLYRKTLPNLARRRDSCQARWPVFLDHCFARIILDNAVGKSKPWGEVIKAPAVRNMSEEQLRRAIDLGKQIAAGDQILVELDKRSLELRGKSKGGQGTKRQHDADEHRHLGEGDVRKKAQTRKGEMADIWSTFDARSKQREDKIPDKVKASTVTDAGLPTPPATSSRSSSRDVDSTDQRRQGADVRSQNGAELSVVQARINDDKTLTPFRRRVLTLLTQVPRGRYSTYKALAAGIAASASQPTSKSSARAVGSAMRNNPFAPEVPCHRVLAADGKIGGFGGDWGDEGRFAKEKRRLLREEGVRFDGHGRVVGLPFTDFQ